MEGKWAPQIGKENKYQYNGKELDDEFGLNLYHYGFRLYDAAIGRFPSADPIAENFANVSPYNYAENNPTTYIDLWGLQKARFIPSHKRPKNYNSDYRLFVQENPDAEISQTFLERLYSFGHALGWALPSARGLKGTGVVDDLARSGDDLTQLPGSLSIENGAKFANAGEETIAKLLVSEGKNVNVLAEATKDGIKTADFLVDGVKTELKTISNITSKDLSGKIATTIRRASKQAGDIIIDVTNQKGATQDVVNEAIKRVFGASEKVNSVRAIGDGFDISKARN